MRTTLTACFGLAAIVAAACGGSGKPRQTPSPTPSPTVAPSTTDSAPSPTAPATVTGPMFVYETVASGYLYNSARRTIRTVDLATGATVSSFDYGDVADPAVTSVLTAEGGLVWVTQRALRAGSLDGVKWQRDFVPPEGLVVGDAAVSHDGRYVAVSVLEAQPESSQPLKGEVVIIDLHADPARGDPPPIQFDRSNPQLKNFPDFGALAWLADDAGVEVRGLTYNEGPGPLATLFRDGRVSVASGGWRLLSPDGKHVAVAGGAACLSPAHDLSIRDPISDAVAFKVSDPGQAFIASEWAPDSSELLYASYQLDRDHPYCDDPQPTPVWWVIGSAGGTAKQIADPDVVRRAWYGPNIAELQCPAAQPAAIAPPANGYLSCGDPYPAGTLTIGGAVVGSATAVRTLGMVQP